MADLYAYRAKSATWNASAINGLTDAAVTPQGSATDLNTDADPVIKGTMVDGLSVEASFSCTDLDSVKGIGIGDQQNLVIVYERRADGKGAAASPTRTATLANAVCLTNNAPAQSQGHGSFTVTFRAKSVAWT